MAELAAVPTFGSEASAAVATTAAAVAAAAAASLLRSQNFQAGRQARRVSFAFQLLCVFPAGWGEGLLL